MLNPVNKAICRTFLCALAFTSFAGAQIVERSRTLADLLQSHPCNSGLAGRHTIVTDCDAADDLGNGGGAFSCFARCDGVDTWAAVSIGGGAGGGGGEATSVQGSATLPATCTELDLYQDTNSGGTEFYVCTAANTWTKTGTGDVLLAGDADGQTIQGRSGADKARVDIGETDPDQVTLIGPGATPGRVYAYSGGVYAVSPDGLSLVDVYDTGLALQTAGDLTVWGATSSIFGIASGPTTIQGAKIQLSSQQTAPTNANDTCTAGDFIPTTGFIYFCTATDTWKRVAIATWP